MVIPYNMTSWTVFVKLLPVLHIAALRILDACIEILKDFHLFNQATELDVP